MDVVAPDAERSAANREGPPGNNAGGDQRLQRAVVLGAVIAVVIGLAASGGALFGRVTGTEASTGDALPYILAGALCGALIAVTALVAATVLERWPGWGVALALVAIAALLGALLGAAFAPDPTDAEDVSPLSEEEIERRREEYGELDENARAGPIDRDGDGQPDLDADGNPIIGYDRDGDGSIDGYLVPCPPGSPEPHLPPELIAQGAPILAASYHSVSFRPEIIDDGTDDGGSGGDPPRGSIDWECDGTIDAIIEYDPDQLLDGPFSGPLDEQLNPSDRPFEPNQPYETPETIPDEEREERAEETDEAERDTNWLRTIGWALLIAAVIAALIFGLVWYLRRRSDDDGDDDDDDEVDESLPPPTLQRSIEASLDDLERDADPRQAILAAYGRLLGGFDELGLGRLAHEGPEEHLRRALADSQVAPDAAHDLTRLFTLARFSQHPIGEAQRAEAIDALHRALPQSAAAT